MKIRCNNCYKVLNNDEVWCTRCGAHSDEVEEIMKSGITPIDESEIGKKSIIMYLLFAFVINGFLDVLFGVVFNSVNSGYDLGDVGQNLPLALTTFSSINSLMIVGIILAPIVFLINYKDLKEYFRIEFNKKSITSLVIGVIIVTFFAFLTKYTNINFIVPYFKDFLMNHPQEMLLSGSVSTFKIIIILLLFVIIEEIVFRKAFISWLDQTTLLPDGVIIDLQTLLSTALQVLCFLLLVSTSISNYIYFILSNLCFNALLAVNYYHNNRNIFINLIIRVVFIILLVIIL
ncbi:MAG: hypothetical protein IKC22_03130 [Bacilli bacterium]|nr:hypothetical protein [Bacilli bacterium]